MAIESTAGDVQAQVELLCRHLISGGEFTQSSYPSIDDVERSIEEAEAEILSWVGSQGYETDTSAWGTIALNYVEWYNALGAAYRIELAHSGASFGTRGAINTRADSYYNLYQKFKEDLLNGLVDLGALGIPLSTGNLSASITGVSHTDKETLTTDSDVVQPSFKRDMLRYPGNRIVPEDPK